LISPVLFLFPVHRPLTAVSSSYNHNPTSGLEASSGGAPPRSHFWLVCFRVDRVLSREVIPGQIGLERSVQVGLVQSGQERYFSGQIT